MKISLKANGACVEQGCWPLLRMRRKVVRKVVLHGSVQSDVLIPEEDEKIGTGTYSDWG